MRPVIHIGVGKTATTTLQNGLLARHPAIRNAGRPYGDPEGRRAAEAIMELDDRDFDAAWLSGHFAAHRAAAEREGTVLVLSDELLSATPMPSVTARRLAALLPDARVVCTLRTQDELATSFYLNHASALKDVPRPWLGRHVAFDDWFDHAVATFPRSYLGLLRFDRLLAAFADAFGPDRMEVMLYEDLIADAGAYWARWAVLLGLEPQDVLAHVTAKRHNERGSARRARYQALRSLLLPGRSLTGLLPGGALIRRAVGRFLDSGRRRSVALGPAQREALRTLFAAGNAQVASRFKLDLASRGYPL